MAVFFLLPLIMCVVVSGQLLLKKNVMHVPIGREVYLEPSDLQFQNSTRDAVCKVEALSNDPMTQQVGVFLPQVFDCAFKPETVKYVHHGSAQLLNDTVRFRAYKLLERDTISEDFDMLFIIRNISYEVIQPSSPLVIKEFFGFSDSIDESVLSFNFSRADGATCKVRLTRHVNRRPAHGQIIMGREKKTVDVMKRKCDDFLKLGLRYEHLKPPSPNIDFVLIGVEVSDPNLKNGDPYIEWYQIPVIIEPGFPNLPPKASFSGMYLMDVDQFIITVITPVVLSAFDSETPSDRLVFNISRPLLENQGSIVHLSDRTRPITSFRQSDLNDFNIAYKPPLRSFKERQMFEIGFVIRDPDFSFSELFTMHVAVRPAITSAPRVSMNAGLVLLEGQSRPLRKDNIEIVDADNIRDVVIFVSGGLHHGRLEVNGRQAVSFKQEDIESEVVVYHHDDSDSGDYIRFRIDDGSHSTHVQFPITVIGKDDSPPSLVVNVGLKASDGGDAQITPSFLRAVDLDSTDDNVRFVVTKPPLAGSIRRKSSWERIGVDVSAFTQEDLNRGVVYYHHNDSEIFNDIFEITLEDSNDPPNVSPPHQVFVRISPTGDDPPKPDPASSFHLEVRETDVGIFTDQNMHFLDSDSPDRAIVFSITTPVRFIGSVAHSDTGKIVKLSEEMFYSDVRNLSAISSFTQEQINHQKIAYLPPNKEIGPSPLYLQFIFSVVDKDRNVVSGQVFNITVLPVNNQAPRLHTGKLIVEEGSATLLSTNELSVYDPDTLSSDLQMSLFTLPLHGSLCRSDQQLRVGDLLSLDDILTLRLEYTHDGSENFKDVFKVGVNDGLHFVSGDVWVSVEPVDDEEPIWKRDLLQQIALNEGGKILLTSEVLAASDVDTDDGFLYFILTEGPHFGSIAVDRRKANRFSQMDIAKQKVFYIHNNQEIGPNPKEDFMTFIVTDKAFPRTMPRNTHRISVSILPQNNQPPRLFFKRALLVEEGRQCVVAEDNLSATDEDTFPAELLLVITKQPEYGYLENLRPSPGYETARSKRISAFPLQDVKDGFIMFVQHNHSGTEPESDDFEVLVTDGVHNSSSVLVYVSIVLLNDEIPHFYISNITLDEGDSYVISNDSLVAEDRDYPGDILFLTLKVKPKHGTLTHFLQAINNGPLLEVLFNQMTADNFERLIYNHDGSENFVDSFVLSLSDGAHSVSRTCFVEIVPVNDEPPVIARNITAENVELQGYFTLSTAVLYAEDADSIPSEILYKIVVPVSYGILEKKTSNGSWIALDPLIFSQKDLDLNAVRYHQVSKPPSTYNDSFTFFLSDGKQNSSTHTFTFKLVDYGKSRLNVHADKIVLEHGNDVVLNSSLLFAHDNSMRTEDIAFRILKSPDYGNLILDGNASFENFTVFDILNNRLSYKHNASLDVNTDSFELSITNGVVTKNATVLILVSSLNYSAVLHISSPLYVNALESKSIELSREHLSVREPSLAPRKIIYEIVKRPRYGLLRLGNTSNAEMFSQEDINKGLLTYSIVSNYSVSDDFIFKISRATEDGYTRRLHALVEPTIFQIYINSTEEAPVVFINSPENLENVWQDQLGFSISSYNLKAAYHDPVDEIKFTVTKYLKHGYLFHTRDGRIVSSFTQQDINDQQVVVIVANKTQGRDHFTFKISANGTVYSEEFKMEFHWAVVYFPFAEYSVCEDVGSLNIIVQRSGNVNVSSYVTISALEQTAKEGLDYVSRRVSKIQYDPGMVEFTWKIVIVQDDLEEAPIEQLQIFLTDPENCLIGNHNKTLVSIYDFNRRACSDVPIWRPQDNNVIDVNVINSDGGVENNGDEDKYPNFISPLQCTRHTYGLLHYDNNSRTLLQCDGERWFPWHPESTVTLRSTEVTPPEPLPDYEIGVNENLDDAGTDEPLVPESGRTTQSGLERNSCLKGWQEFSGKCFKWHRQPATWEKARQVCRGYPFGNLAIVESAEQNHWLLQVARSKPFWIGLHSVDESSYWNYLRNNDVPFFNWKKGFPRSSSGGETKRCVLVRGSGLWINKNCTGHEHSFLCSTPLLSSAVV